jgi:hypothetical protein
MRWDERNYDIESEIQVYTWKRKYIIGKKRIGGCE